MRDLRGCGWLDCIGTIGSAISSLTVMRKSFSGGPVKLMMDFVNASEAGNPRAAQDCAMALTSELLTCGARRISGDILCDYILETLLLSDNPFAAAAASGRTDDALFNAMRQDLTALRQLTHVNEAVIDKVLIERSRDISRRPRTASDPVSAIASAAWGGGTVHHVPKDYPQEPAVIPTTRSKSVWEYGEFALRDSYYADEALEEMYRRLLSSEDWADMTEDLWNFHSSYGCGCFLRCRNFYFDRDAELKPLPDLRAGDFVPLADAEYRVLLNNAIAFMRDESARPMLLSGAHGMGKTTIMLELTDELPQMRLVYVTGGWDRLTELFSVLRAQPIKFMVLIDDLTEKLLSGICEPMLPTNVLLAACATEPLLPGLFEVTAELPKIVLNDLVQIVSKLLTAQQISLPTEVIRSACIDYQVDTKCEFNIAAAVRIAELLQS